MLCEIIGLAAAIFPEAWLALFGTDPAMIEAGSAYLRAVGPFYGCFGFGLALYFASQGAGRLIWPLLAGFARMTVAIGGGWLALKLTGSLAACSLRSDLRCSSTAPASRSRSGGRVVSAQPDPRPGHPASVGPYPRGELLRHVLVEEAG